MVKKIGSSLKSTYWLYRPMYPLGMIAFNVAEKQFQIAR
jgi:hypothetical protein